MNTRPGQTQFTLEYPAISTDEEATKKGLDCQLSTECIFTEPKQPEQYGLNLVYLLLNAFLDASYSSFPKLETNKVRILHNPNYSMRAAHEIIKAMAAQTGAVSPYATARQGGPLINARRHLNNRYFYDIDLKSAYDQIQMPVLAQQLHDYGFAGEINEIEQILNRFCRKPNSQQGLCQGGPASPLLFDIALYEVDQHLAAICKRYGLTFSRYSDNITISGAEKPGDKKRRKIRDVLTSAGLVINYAKTHLYDLDKGPVTITGIQINHSGACILPRKNQRMVTAAINVLGVQVFENGQPLTKEQLEQLGGYKGMVMSSIDARRSELTPFERTTLVNIEALRASRKPKITYVDLGFTAIKFFKSGPAEVECDGNVNSGRVIRKISFS
jgi:hypothetical protein